jgi:hypothetical protein
MKPTRPVRSHFSLQEAAIELEISVESLNKLVFDYKLIRPAVETRYLTRFIGVGELSCQLVNDEANDLSELYERFTEHDERAAAAQSIDLLHNAVNIHGSARWRSPPPKYLYLNLYRGLMHKHGAQIPLRDIRIDHFSQTSFKLFETFEKQTFSIVALDTGQREEVFAETIVITSRELNRFIQAVKDNISSAEGINKAEKHKIYELIGRLILILDNHSGKKFRWGKEINVKSVVEYLAACIVQNRGDGTMNRTLHKHISEALKRLK